MKKQYYIFSLIACMLLVFNNIKAQQTPVDEFLKKYPSAEGVTHISMSKQMLKSIFELSQPLTVPEAYNSLTLSRKDIPEYFYTDFIKILTASKYESYMEIKSENNQRMSYYIKEVNVHNNEIVVLRQQKDNFSSIYIKGDIDMDNLDVYLGQIRNHLLNLNETGTEFTRDLTPPTGKPPVTPGTANRQQAKVSIEDAVNTALATTGGGTVVRVETKNPPHGMEYIIMIVDGDNRYNVHVNANSGQINNYHTDRITKVAHNAKGRDTSGIISAESAKSIALKIADGGIITDCNLDFPPHLGVLTYHIHVGKGQYEYCVELFASTGVVFKVEPRHKP
jgi:uncharacterized membrane protein YkoI